MNDSEALGYMRCVVHSHTDVLLGHIARLRETVSTLATDGMDVEQIRWHAAGFLEALDAMEGLVVASGKSLDEET